MKRVFVPRDAAALSGPARLAVVASRILRSCLDTTTHATCPPPPRSTCWRSG